MKVLKAIGYILGGLFSLIVVAVLIALWVYRDIPAEELEAKYANESSRFINIDGVRMHYRDEGKKDGPVIILIHAHFASLLGWEDWVDALKDKYRVIRFDMTSHGLTGPDPSGDYTVERTVDLTEKFVDALGLDTFSMGGTSLGGTIVLHYTARHPDKVNNIVLLSPGSLEGREQIEKRGKPGKSANVLHYILPRALPEFMLSSAWGETAPLPEELVDRWYDMWMREGQREAELERIRQYEPDGIEAIIEAVQVPVLILWGEANPQAPMTQAPEFIAHLDESPLVQFKSYPGVGHMAVQEAGVATGADVRLYLDGKLELPDARGEDDERPAPDESE